MHFLPDDGSKARLLGSIAARLNAGAPYIHVDAYDPTWGWPQNRVQEIRRHYLTATGAFADEAATTQFVAQARDIHARTGDSHDRFVRRSRIR